MSNYISIIKVVLAVLLILCLMDMPYGFYQFVRFIALIGFGVLAFLANERGKQKEMLIYGALALLFQPFFKIALGRELWNLIDVAVAVGIIVTLFKKKIT